MNTKQPQRATHQNTVSGTYLELVGDKVNIYVLGTWHSTSLPKRVVMNNRYIVKL